MEHREHANEVSYVVSGPEGNYDYDVASVEEAYRIFDREGGSAAGWAIGVNYSDGTTSFEHPPLRPIKRAA